MPAKIKYFKRFIFNYKFFIFRVLYFEILYSLRYLEFVSHLSTTKHKIATDTVLCIYYFLYKISKFKKTNKHWYYWCACKESNLKPPDPKSDALSN